jgi:serine/threonine-protein kinase
VGSVIADTYTIETLIGRGGMGAVFLASHLRLPGKQVAIKILHAEMSGDEVLARFRREAEIASRLGHPNIVQVHDFNVMPDGTPYLVLEYLRGESLAQRLRRGPVPLDQALSIVRQVGSALAAAHREGIVHRDLKPQNIFLVPTEVDGRSVEIAKVLDFGISKIRGSQTVKTQDSALLGTPQYMAPEQATGQHELVDDRTDVFAFGAIVYEMLSGKPAFSGETIPEVVFKVVYEQPTPLAQHVGSLPAAITSAVHRAMAKVAGERFANVGQFVEALTGQPITLSRAGAALPTDLGVATGARTPSANHEAFAQTVGSGDHGPALPREAASAEAAPTEAAARASAPTVDSQKLGTDATVSAGPGTPLPRTGGRKASLVLAGVLGLAALAAGGVYLASRDRGADRSAGAGSASYAHTADGKQAAAGVPQAAAGTPQAVAGEQQPAAGDAQAAAGEQQPAAGDAQATADSPQPAAGDPRATAGSPQPAAGDPRATAGSSQPATGAPRATAKQSADSGKQPAAGEQQPAAGDRQAMTGGGQPPPGGDKQRTGGNRPAATGGKQPANSAKQPPGDDDDGGGDEAIAQKLAEAQAALDAGHWDRAEALANSVRTSEDASPRQRARATLIAGIVQCAGRNDEGRARVALRQLAGSPRLRRKLIEACHRAGALQNER